MMEIIKNLLRKNASLMKVALYIYNFYQNRIVFWKSTFQNRMSPEEKRFRKEMGIGLSITETFLDSNTFWLFYNVSKNVMKRNSDKEWTVIDVGASNGWFSTVFEKFSPKNTKFMLFEPQPVHYAECKELALNSPNYTFFRRHWEKIQLRFLSLLTKELRGYLLASL